MATVIVGSGLSALTCALSLPRSEQVIILTKGKKMESNSVLAQGGIAASENLKADIDEHIHDTLKAGSETNCRETVEHMIANSYLAIDFLKQNGVDFDMKNNKIHLTREGGHSRRRILHVGGDQSGKLIIKSLIEVVEQRTNIQVIENARVISLSADELIYFQEGEVKYISASNYVIAAGGATGNFAISTANKLNTGDYLNIAKSAKLTLEDMHLFQFHPTAFKPENAKQAFLISEAVRGEGAYLVNQNGERFMGDIHEMSELAPRDIVAREIFRQLQLGNVVYIDARHLPNELLEERFVQINAFLRNYQLNLKQNLIPIVPAAHYQLGGIATKFDGSTNQENIYAIGECATTGFHGSNRLASNSLLECVIMGQACAESIAQSNRDKKTIVGIKEKLQIDTKNYALSKTLMAISDELSIVRERENIEKLIKELQKELVKHEKRHRFSNEWYDYYNLLLMGVHTANSALCNKSTGCHFIKENND